MGRKKIKRLPKLSNRIHLICCAVVAFFSLTGGVYAADLVIGDSPGEIVTIYSGMS